MDNGNKKVSVIVPCYNAVDCIDRCLGTIVNQTIGVKNLEIILVNDASTDKTLDKLCGWEEKYPDSVMVINCEENGKQGQARNIGMQYASGEYIGFADDDDILEDVMFEVLYSAASDKNSDISVCGSVRHGIDGYSGGEAKNNYNKEFYTIQTFDERIGFLNRDLNIAIWNKIYKRDFLYENNISFPAGYIYDDIYFSALVKQYAKTVCVTDRVLYHHIISNSSASYSTKNKYDRIGFLEVHMILVEELRRRGVMELYGCWYEREFIIDYLSFVVNYTKSFGKMDEELAHIIRENVVGLFLDYKEIPIVKDILNSDKDTPYKKILMEL